MSFVKYFFLINALFLFIVIDKTFAQEERTASVAGLTVEQVTPQYITENQYKIDVLKYSLLFDFDVNKKVLNGTAAISFSSKDKSLNVIDLNFYDNMVIENLHLNGINVKFNHAGTKLSIPFVIEKDTNVVIVKYHGTPKKEGLSAFVFGHRNNLSVVYNLSEPNYASTFFPCNDIPSDKALLEISMTNDSSFTSISNGILKDVKYENGKRTFSWETIYPISTYLISVYSSKYESFSETYISLDKKDTMEIKYYAFPDHLEKAKRDFENHPEMIKILAELFGEYPFIKEKYGVAEFLWQLGAMENQTITGIGSTLVTGNNDFEDVLVHELAHSWWGNSVGPKSWKDIWLNEGFATYSEILYYEKKFGKPALISGMEALKDDFTGRLYNPESDLFDIMIYNKGAWVLHMLRTELGDKTFFRLIKEYYHKFKYSNASTEDLVNLCEEVSGKDMKLFFDQWVYKGESVIYSDIMYRTIEKNGKNILQFKLRQTSNIYVFPLKIRITIDGISNDHVVKVENEMKDFEFEVSGDEIEVTIDPDSELLGYFNIKDKTKENLGQ